MLLPTLTTHLDTYLRIADVPDYDGAVNGLQVENAGEVVRIVAAVDASQAAIDHAAAGPGPALLLVHHGLFWDGNRPVTGWRYRRLSAALRADLAIYAAHLPLDVPLFDLRAHLVGERMEAEFGKQFHRGRRIETGATTFVPGDFDRRVGVEPHQLAAGHGLLAAGDEVFLTLAGELLNVLVHAFERVVLL